MTCVWLTSCDGERAAVRVALIPGTRRKSEAREQMNERGGPKAGRKAGKSRKKSIDAPAG
jgi:hypothetical protein